MAQILIIDDDRMMNEALSSAVELTGHEVANAYTLTEGIKKVNTGCFDVVYLDVCMPDGNGLDILPGIKHSPSEPEVIIITGNADMDGAELAIKNGAWDYIQKPSSIGSMTLPLVRALEYRKEKKDKFVPVLLKREEIIGNSRALDSSLLDLAGAAASESDVLVTGETGTGKELFARAIHNNSPRAGNNFVVVDCAALPDSLVESILFGHEKGTFTGADRSKKGLIQQAHQGTLFLDEVGELPPAVQKTFLRVIQEKKFRPVGAENEICVDFRIVAATNRDLEKMAEKGEFRQDLLFRLKALQVKIPPLRERREDIKDIAIHHAHRLCELYGMETKGFSPDFFDSLKIYDWPGNVRELVNTLKQALSAAACEPTLFSCHLPTDIRICIARKSVNKEETPISQRSPESFSAEEFPDFKTAKDHMEYEYMQKLMLVSQGSRKEACSISGLSRTRLFELLKKYGI